MPKIFFLLALATASFAVRSQDQSQWTQQEVEADTLMARQEYDGAIQLYSKLITETGLKEKSQFKLLYKRAVAYFSQEDSKNALEDISRFITEFPEVPRAKILRALIYRQLNDTDHQLEDIESALAGQETISPELLRWRGALYLEKEQFQKAKADFLSVRNYTDDAELETNLGLVYYSLGSLDSALVSLNKAIELDVTYQSSYIYAGSFCVQENKYDLAVEYLNLGLRLDPTNRAGLFYKGVALVESEKIKAGCSCLRKAFEAGEDDAADYLKEFCYGVYK